VLYIPARLPRYDASLPHYEKVTPDAHCDLLMFRADLASAQIIHAHICHSQGRATCAVATVKAVLCAVSCCIGSLWGWEVSCRMAEITNATSRYCAVLFCCFNR